jgi:hypothetical protein
LNIRGAVAGDHAHEHALSHARAGEHAQALPAAHGVQRIDAANAGADRFVDPHAFARRRRGPDDRVLLLDDERPLAVRRLTQSVHHPADHLPADSDEGSRGARLNCVTG